MDCIFCKISKKEIPASIVYEDKEVISFMDIQPINQGHVLVVPKSHKKLIIELNDDLVSHLFKVGKEINNKIRKSGIKCEGINLLLADGEAAGQEVFHSHLHVIPRFKNDGFEFKFPENYKNKPSRNELDIIAKKIGAVKL